MHPTHPLPPKPQFSINDNPLYPRSMPKSKKDPALSTPFGSRSTGTHRSLSPVSSDSPDKPSPSSYLSPLAPPFSYNASQQDWRASIPPHPLSQLPNPVGSSHASLSPSSSPAWGNRSPRSVSQESDDSLHQGRGTPSDRRGTRLNTGGPPKAILGGPGGKTYEELAKKTSPIPDEANPPDSSPSPSTPKWKGKSIAVTLPPASYDPPDSPRTIKPSDSPQKSPDVQQESQKRSRKDAFPWRHTRANISASNIPLPGSPRSSRVSREPAEDAQEDASGNQTKGPSWRGKELIVQPPEAYSWERLISAARDVRQARETASPEKAVDVFEASRTEPRASEEPSPRAMHTSKRSNQVGNNDFLKRTLGNVLTKSNEDQAATRAQDPKSQGIALVQDKADVLRQKMNSDEAASQLNLPQSSLPTPNAEEKSLISWEEVAPVPALIEGRTPTDQSTPRPPIGKDLPTETEVNPAPSEAPAQSDHQSPPASSGLSGNSMETTPQIETGPKVSQLEKQAELRPTASAFLPRPHLVTTAPPGQQSNPPITPVACFPSDEAGRNALRPGAPTFRPVSERLSSISSVESFNPPSITSRILSDHTSSVISSPSPPRRTASLRAAAPSWMPGARSSGASTPSHIMPSLMSDNGDKSSVAASGTSSPTKLRPTASTFVPSAAPGALKRTVSSPVKESLSVKGESTADTEIHGGESISKRTKLRPIAPPFQPSSRAVSDYPRRKKSSTSWSARRVDEADKLVPDYFQFQPALQPEVDLRHLTSEHTAIDGDGPSDKRTNEPEADPRTPIPEARSPLSLHSRAGTTMFGPIGRSTPPQSNTPPQVDDTAKSIEVTTPRMMVENAICGGADLPPIAFSLDCDTTDTVRVSGQPSQTSVQSLFGVLHDSPASKASMFSHSTPPRQLQRQFSSSTNPGNETFETADGSPLRPRRSPMPYSTQGGVSDTPSRFSKSPATSEETTPADNLSNDSIPPRVQRDPMGDNWFREWVFPLHGTRPSISRRHTLPSGLSLDRVDVQSASTHDRMLHHDSGRRPLHHPLDSMATSAERDRLSEAVSSLRQRLILLETGGKARQEELDRSMATCIAAESVRDALGKSLIEAKKELEKIHWEVERSSAMQQSLISERDKIEATTKSQIDSLELALKHSQQESAKLQRLATDHHEVMLAKIATLHEAVKGNEEGLSGQTILQQRNAELQAEVEALRVQLSNAMDSNAVIRTSHATDKARLEAEKQAITDQLALEAAATTKAQKVFEDLRAKLQLAQQETSHAKMMAIERQTAARMSEIRLQSVSQEGVYWRQFALESDRKRYDAFMTSQPFRPTPNGHRYDHDSEGMGDGEVPKVVTRPAIAGTSMPIAV